LVGIVALVGIEELEIVDASVGIVALVGIEEH